MSNDQSNFLFVVWHCFLRPKCRSEPKKTQGISLVGKILEVKGKIGFYPNSKTQMVF